MTKIKLSDICNPKQWKTIPTSELLEEGYPVYGANGIIGYYSEFNHENPVVAVTCRGATCGSINITVPKAYVTGNAMCLDDVRSDIEMEYLYYCLKHYDFNNVISGSAQPQITRQGMDKIYITVCTHDEQISIVNKLKRVERVVELRKQELKSLDDLIKARFVELFGEYYKNHINEKQLDEICDFIDYRGKTPEKSESGIPLITAKNVKDNKFSIKPQEFIPEENYDDVMTRGIPRVNDVLFTTEAPLGNVCRIPDVYERFCVGQRLITMQPHTEVINSEYLEHALASAEFQEKMWQKSSGSTVKGIRSKLLVLLTIPVPPMELQVQFAGFVHQVDKSKFGD